MASTIFDGERGKICGFSVLFHRDVYGGKSVVVRNPGIHQVDSYPFRCDIGTAARLPNRDQYVRSYGTDLFCKKYRSSLKSNREFLFFNGMACNLIREQTDCFIRRVDGLAAERRKTGDQNNHKKYLPFCYRGGIPTSVNKRIAFLEKVRYSREIRLFWADCFSMRVWLENRLQNAKAIPIMLTSEEGRKT